MLPPPGELQATNILCGAYRVLFPVLPIASEPYEDRPSRAPQLVQRSLAFVCRYVPKRVVDVVVHKTPPVS